MAKQLFRSKTNCKIAGVCGGLGDFFDIDPVFFRAIFIDLLTGMEFDLFVPSFPQLQSHFHLSASWVEALLSVNFIGYCISVLIVGNLSDRYGRKPIILLGLIVFVIGSLVCLVENDFTLLLLGRLLQGIGIAAPAILSFLIIADHYPLQKQQFLMAMLNGSMNIAVGISPVIGSYIALYFHWRGNFTVLLSLGILACILTLFFVPQYSLPDKKQNQTSTGYITLFQSTIIACHDISGSDVLTVLDFCWDVTTVIHEKFWCEIICLRILSRHFGICVCAG